MRFFEPDFHTASTHSQLYRRAYLRPIAGIGHLRNNRVMCGFDLAEAARERLRELAQAQ